LQALGLLQVKQKALYLANPKEILAPRNLFSSSTIYPYMFLNTTPKIPCIVGFLEAPSKNNTQRA